MYGGLAYGQIGYAQIMAILQVAPTANTDGMWVTLSAALKAKLLAGITSMDPACCFEYAESNAEVHPYISIIPVANQTASFADGVRVNRDYTFSLNLYQERIDQAEDGSEDLLRRLADEVTSLLDSDRYLDNALRSRGYTRPTSTEWSFIDSEQVNTRLARITVPISVIQ